MYGRREEYKNGIIEETHGNGFSIIYEEVENEDVIMITAIAKLDKNNKTMSKRIDNYNKNNKNKLKSLLQNLYTKKD